MGIAAPVRARRGSLSASAGLDVTDAKWMVGLFVVGFALRLWLALSVGQTPTTKLNDPTVYQAIATNLANGHGFRGIAGQTTAQFPPAYPFLLSLVFRVFGVHRTAGAIVNVFLGAATIPLLYFTARRTLGRTEAVFAGIGLTLLLSQVLYSDLLLSDTLFAFEVVLLLALATVVGSGQMELGLGFGGRGRSRDADACRRLCPDRDPDRDVVAGAAPPRDLASSRSHGWRRARVRRAVDDPQCGGDAWIRPDLHRLRSDAVGRPQSERLRRTHGASVEPPEFDPRTPGDPRSTSSPSTASFSAKHSPGRWRTPLTSFA